MTPRDLGEGPESEAEMATGHLMPLATPDATLDGLLDAFGFAFEAECRYEVSAQTDTTRAAIHAHVAQREAALRADNERLRKAMEQAKEQLTEAARFCGSRLIRADLDNIYYDINAALASPPPATAETTEARCSCGIGDKYPVIAHSGICNVRT